MRVNNHSALRGVLRYFIGVLALFVVCLSAVVSSNAQSTGGRIRGTVTDPSGGAVAGATLVLINEANGTHRESESAASGEYIFLEVPVGTYQVEVSQKGFKKYLRKGLIVSLNEVLTLDIPLQLGGSTEVVEVTGAAALVDTTSTQLGAVVNERAVSQLPLAQRDAYQLLQLQPGVQSQVGLDTVYGSDRAGVVSVNGGRGRDNNFTVNGGDGNDQFAGLPAIQPSPDAIAEFRVLTNTFDAEYGRNSGAVVNVVTKSGTNDIHGSAYEFFRNDALNARGFFDSSKLAYLQNQFGGTLGGPVRKDKTFFFVSYEGDRIRRGTSGDTVNVPTLAERNGDFSEGGNGQFQGALSSDAFATTLNARCGLSIPTPSLQPNGSVPWATIFPNQHIPTNCFDPTAVDLFAQYVPAPNVGDSFFQGVPLGHERSNQFTLKIDHELTRNQRLTGYYYLTDHYLAKPFARFQAGGANLPGFGDLTDERIQQINISHTWTIGAAAVNELRFTLFREGQGTFLHPQHTALVQDSCKTVATANCFADPSNPDIGIHPGLGATREGVPFINISGGFNIGNNFEGELPQAGNTFQWSDNFSKTFGKHDLKFGGDVRYQKFDQTLFFDISGQYFYFGGGPNDPSLQVTDPSTGNTSQNLFPNYFLGLPDEYGQGSAQQERVRTKALYLFAQDSYKLRPNVTLNYGLRWELTTPQADAGRKVQTFRPGQATTIYPCQLSGASQATLGFPDGNCNPGGSAQAVFPLGLVVPGDKGIPNGLSNTYYKSFAPRIGVAWSPAAKDGFLGKLFGGPGKTSVRAGFGVFYNPVEQLVLEQFSAEPPFGGSTFVFNTQFNTPFRGQDGTTTFPNPFNGILNPPRGQPVDWSVFRPILLFGQAAKDPRTQYAEQYNLTIQRELAKDMVLQVAYVGRQGHRLLASQDLNPGNPQTCLDLQNVSAAIGDPSVACGPFLADSPYTFTLPVGMTFHLPYASPATPGGPNIPCPIANAPAACTITGASGGTPVTLVGTRPYSSPFCDPLSGNGCPPDGIPVISDIFTQNTISNSAYNGFQASLEKRFSHGLQFEAAYTYGKSIDNASTFESLVDPVNPKRNRSLSLFDARNRFVLSYYWELPIPKFDGFKGKALNGWAMSGITTFQSGFPIRITEQDDIELQSSFDFETPGQPNVAAPFHKLDPRGPGNLGFNPEAFTESTVPPGTIGNAPRTICCGPGINNWEIAFQKITPIGERLKLEFRGELFNAFNHAQFFQPDGNFTDGSDFGRVKRARDPRLVQFALKLSF